MHKVNIAAKGQLFKESWQPKIIAELNGQYVKLAKFKGEFGWHKHEHEDEMFQVVEGSIEIRLREQTIRLDAGEFLVVPRGVEHNPYAENEALVMLFEPAATLNTGDTVTDKTVEKLERL